MRRCHFEILGSVPDHELVPLTPKMHPHASPKTRGRENRRHEVDEKAFLFGLLSIPLATAAGQT